MISPGGEGGFRLRTLAATVYLPTILFAVGEGAASSVIALAALDLGASPALAGVIVGLRGLGRLLFDVPAGVLIARYGEKRSMIATGIALAVIGGALWATQSLWMFAILVTLMGCAWGIWQIGRLAFATAVSEVEHRGRVMSTIGGSTRIGLLVGPALASLIIPILGLNGAFLVLAGLAAVAALSVALAPASHLVLESVGEQRATLLTVVRDHRRILLTAGSLAVIAQILRSSREVLIPLWATGIGVDAATIPLIFTASYLVESVVFYPVGILMDRKGRKWAFTPFIALLGLGLAAIPAASTLTALTVVAMVIGLANGLGAGMNMTLASDLSPIDGRSRFLGLWRLISDLGAVGGPLLVAAVTSAATLAVAAISMGGVGAIGLLILWRLVPETLPARDSSPRDTRNMR